MNHTPAPWTVAPGRDKTHPHNIESRSPECDGFDLARCVKAADAALIAAAPDLLAALQQMMREYECLRFEQPERWPDAATAARAAIAKATNPEN